MARVSKKSITLWRIRLCIIVIACAAVTSYFATPFSITWNVVTAGWATVFLFMYFLYYPAKYRRFSFYVDENRIIVKSGVIYRYEKYMDIDRVQYLNFVACPIQRIMGLNGVLILCAGSRIYIPCLDREDTKSLLKKIGG